MSLALLTVGVILWWPGPIVGGSATDTRLRALALLLQVVEGVLALADLIDYRYILAVSSVYWGHYDKWRELVQGAGSAARRRLKTIYASVVQASILERVGKSREAATASGLS